MVARETLVHFFVSILFLFSNPFSNTAIASAQQQQETGRQRNSAPTDPIKPVPKQREPWQDDEDFDSLSIAQSNLQPEAPLVGAVDKQPDFTRELIQVHWRFGDPIDLWVMSLQAWRSPRLFCTYTGIRPIRIVSAMTDIARESRAAVTPQLVLCQHLPGTATMIAR